ncbi:MAG TPA: diguanylate cyclase [Acetobacteraceae bacterium]|jgi:diguanylate cyclase (GGDEF)-like protein
MFGNREGPELFRRAVAWHWQAIGGVVFSAIAVGLLAASSSGQSPGPLVAIQMLIAVIAAVGGGLIAGLSASVVVVLLHVLHLAPGQSADGTSFAIFAIAILMTGVLVGLAREDLGHIGHELATTRNLLSASNARIERAKETEAMRAYYDPKTELPTRRLVADRFSQILPQARRTGTYAALVLLDLNKFKEVNQNFGYDTGDEVLRQVGQRLSTVMRRGDTVGRLDGNKFIVLLTALSDRGGVDVAVQKLNDALAEPFTVGRPARDLFVSASMGLAVFPDDGEDWDALYSVSDEALRIVKGPRVE